MQNNLLDLSKTIAKNLFSDNIIYLWEVIPKIKEFILELGPKLSKENYIEIKKNVWVSKSADIAKTAYIDAPAIICDNVQIRHCAFIRGSVIVDSGCVVGNSTELKNCILFQCVQVPHFNYIGDSVLGYKSHFGAGSIISNVKSDKTNVSALINGKKINTNLRKFGAIIGDYVEVGCNAVLNPGTIIGRNSSVYPTSMVRGTIDENMIFKSSENIVKKR